MTSTPAVQTDFEVVIGLEVHVQLLTQSKMFCSCSTAYANAAPNTHVCPICMGMPGVLPTMNQQGIHYTLMAALALHCSIATYTKFDRKNYPYPDLMKGYQISQYDQPLGYNGYMDIRVQDQERRIGITRIHLEEDTARLLHRPSYSLIDVNRAGTPLMEIVSEPDIRSPLEASLYMQELRTILLYLGITSGRMEEGSLRCDANISLRPGGQETLGTKVEIKNMNSFRAVERALEYERQRQTAMLKRGEIIHQETRGWVEETNSTVSQRSKEEAHDYRYFPEPDLPPLHIEADTIESVRKALPELPAERRARYTQVIHLSEQDAAVLTAEKALGDYFDAVLSHFAEEQREAYAKNACSWLLGDIAYLTHNTHTDSTGYHFSPAYLADMLTFLEQQRITRAQARTILEISFTTGQSPEEIIHEKNIQPPMNDSAELQHIIADVLQSNPKIVSDYQSGKTNALQALIGQVMKRTKGQANAEIVQTLMRQHLS